LIISIAEGNDGVSEGNQVLAIANKKEVPDREPLSD